MLIRHQFSLICQLFQHIPLKGCMQVVAKDRINLIMDISTVLSSTKTHVGSLNARSTPDGFALITLDTDISSSDQLKTVMRRIEQISGVMRVTRPAG